MMARRVLVTGGSGLLGQAMARVMESEVGKDIEVRYLSSKDADLKDFLATKEIFDTFRPTHVVHLAARVGGVFANMEGNIEFFRENSKIDDTVLRLTHEHGIRRAIFCLSTCVFPSDHSLPLTEADLHNGPPHFSNEGYAIAKRNLEMMVRFHNRKYGYQWVCIVPTNLFGPNDNFNLQDGHVLPALLHRALISQKSGEPMTVAGTGKARRQFLLADDAGRVIWKLIQSPDAKIESPSYILADDEDTEISIKELVDIIIAASKVEKAPVWDTTRAEGVFRKTASNAQLRLFLGPSFRFTPLAEGVELTAKWLAENFETARK